MSGNEDQEDLADQPQGKPPVVTPLEKSGDPVGTHLGQGMREEPLTNQLEPLTVDQSPLLANRRRHPQESYGPGSKQTNLASSKARHDDATELSFLLAEYEALRAEILARIGTESQLTTLAIAVLGGILALAPFFLFSSSPSPARIPTPYLITGLLLSSVLFASILWASLNQEMWNNRLGLYYQHHLRVQAAALLGVAEEATPILNWERYHVHLDALRIDSLKNLLLYVLLLARTGSKFAVMGLPSVLSFIGACLIYWSNFSLSAVDTIGWFNLGLQIFDGLYLVGAALFMIYIRRLLQQGIGPLPQLHK